MKAQTRWNAASYADMHRDTVFTGRQNAEHCIPRCRQIPFLATLHDGAEISAVQWTSISERIEGRLVPELRTYRVASARGFEDLLHKIHNFVIPLEIEYKCSAHLTNLINFGNVEQIRVADVRAIDCFWNDSSCCPRFVKRLNGEHVNMDRATHTHTHKSLRRTFARQSTHSLRSPSVYVSASAISQMKTKLSMFTQTLPTNFFKSKDHFNVATLENEP